jgi:glutaredoxin
MYPQDPKCQRVEQKQEKDQVVKQDKGQMQVPRIEGQGPIVGERGGYQLQGALGEGQRGGCPNQDGGGSSIKST